MGKVKDFALKKQEEGWTDEQINEFLLNGTRRNIVYNNLFDWKDLDDFRVIVIDMINGNSHYIYPNQIREITGISLRYDTHTQLHKDEEVIQVVDVVSIPYDKIVEFHILYDDM